MLQFLESGSTIGKVDNLTMLEIANIRPFIPHALEQVNRIRKVRKAFKDDGLLGNLNANRMFLLDYVSLCKRIHRKFSFLLL